MIGGLDVEGGVLDHRAQQVDRGFAALWQLPASREKVVQSKRIAKRFFERDLFQVRISQKPLSKPHLRITPSQKLSDCPFLKWAIPDRGSGEKRLIFAGLTHPCRKPFNRKVRSQFMM